MIRKIHHWSLCYKIGWYYVKIAHKLFYDKIVIKGLENVPLNSPVILAPNHQNAFMDALIIVCTVPGQTIFMARADIFEKKWQAKIFRFLKIMPIYRLRDGFENLEKNNIIFDEAIDVLRNKKVLCLMPEGTHGSRHFLKPLLKGAFRIALSAAEKLPESPPLIVPVGIDYSNYTSFRSQIIIQFGKPVDVSYYSESNNVNPAETLNELREKLTLEIKKLMIHIDCGDLYETVDYLRQLYRSFAIRKLGYNNQNPWHRYLADKWFTDICNKEYQANSELLYDLKDDISILHIKMDVLKLSPETLFKKPNGNKALILKSVLFIISFPLFAFGYIVNIGLIRFPRIINNKIEDTQFHSSIKLTVTALLFPVYYGILWVLISLIEHNILIQLLVLSGLALLGEFAYRYFQKYKDFKQQLKLKIYRKDISSIYPIWKDVIEKTDLLCNCPNSKIN